MYSILSEISDEKDLSILDEIGDNVVAETQEFVEQEPSQASKSNEIQIELEDEELSPPPIKEDINNLESQVSKSFDLNISPLNVKMEKVENLQNIVNNIYSPVS